MNRSLFITGASGYLGRRVLEQLRSSNYQTIHCLSRGPAPSSGAGPAAWIEGDLLDPASYRRALAGCDTVVHLAALTGKGSAREHFRMNREATRVLVEECRQAGISNFLHVSTIAAKFSNLRYYHYGQAKKQAEEIVAASGLRYAILRPTMIFGKDAPVLEGLSKMAGAPVIPVFGGGETKVQPVDVGDVASGVLYILGNQHFDNQVIELGGPDVLTIEDLLLKIRKARFGKSGRTFHLPASGIAWGLGILEPLLLPLLPITAGQIASFRNDGVAGANPLLDQMKPRMKGIEEMLKLAAADAH
jgi:NADH dehydrogenase